MMDYELYGILVINVLMLDLFNLFWLFLWTSFNRQLKSKPEEPAQACKLWLVQ